MTKPGLSLLAVLLDRSSTVRPAARAIRSGVDALLADQREQAGELQVTLATSAAGGLDTATSARPVADVGPVALRPRGGSALHEGVLTLIDDLGAELAVRDEAERPERVIVLVAGDTGSDASDAERVREAVERQRRDYAWEFVLVDVPSVIRAPERAPDPSVGETEPVEGSGGAPHAGGATAVALAEARLGVPATAALVAGPGPAGVRAGLAAASAFVARARASRPWEPVEGFTDDERVAAAVAAPPSWWRRLVG